MTVDVEVRTAAPSRLTLKLASLLLLNEGVLPHVLAQRAAGEARTGGRQRNATDTVNDGMRKLRDDDVVVKVGDTWYAPNLADLAAWVADGFAAREDAGMSGDPVVPAQRAAA